MAQQCPYRRQLEETCWLVGERLGQRGWQLVYQSRSGPPTEPWLGPDVCDCLRELAKEIPGGEAVLVPIGFTCEHMETVYDLDVAAAAVCEQTGLNMVRSATVGCHPRFVQMICELIRERLDNEVPRLALGTLGPSPDRCPPDCCRLP